MVLTSPRVRTLRTRVEPWDEFNERDRRILGMVAFGKTNAEIAWDRSMAERTVKHHLSRICRALGAENRTVAAALAIQRGIIDPSAWPDRPG